MSMLPSDKKYLFFLGMRNEESSIRSEYEDMWKNIKWSDNWQGCLLLENGLSWMFGFI